MRTKNKNKIYFIKKTMDSQEVQITLTACTVGNAIFTPIH